MSSLLKDALHTLRTFRANRGFTATVIATLVIGIGASMAIFSLVNAVLLEPVAAALLAAVVIAAGYLPALHASRIAPMEALRHE